MLARVIISIAGAYAAKVCHVRTHSRRPRLWLAVVSLGYHTPPVQIVFSGFRRLNVGELVPVAPPGSLAKVIGPGMRVRWKKIRARRYGGEWSHGMMCSLDELGWLRGGRDEVATLCDLKPGECLDDLPPHRRPEVVVEWEWARRAEEATRAKAAKSLAACRHEISVGQKLSKPPTDGEQLLDMTTIGSSLTRR
jgi:tRNA-binding EMAP/Myf-like protein